MSRRALRCTALALPLVLAAPGALAITLDFTGLDHGRIVDTDFAAQGVVITAHNPNRPFDHAVVFDTTRTGTADPDIEGPAWSGGSLGPDTILGEILVLQESDTGCADDVCDDPDDEGWRPAGSFTFDFTHPAMSFGVDLIDIDHDEPGGYLDFVAGGASVGKVFFADLVNVASPWYDPSIAFGNHTANRVSPITVAMLAGVFGNVPGNALDQVVVHLGGSGGIDNVTFAPEPGAFALLAAGLLGLTGWARRARR